VSSLTLASPVFGAPPAVEESGGTQDKAGAVGTVSPVELQRRGRHPWGRSSDPAVRGSILSTKGSQAVPSGFSDGSGPPLSPICLADAVGAGSALIYNAWQPADTGALEGAVGKQWHNTASSLSADPSEFTTTTVKGGGATADGIPTLLTSGKRDLPATKTSLDLARKLLQEIATGGVLSTSSSGLGAEATTAGGKVKRKNPFLSGSPRMEEVVYASSGHMAHLEEREGYLSDLFAFLDACDEADK